MTILVRTSAWTSDSCTTTVWRYCLYKGAERWWMGFKLDSNGDSVYCMRFWSYGCSSTLFYRCFQCHCQCHYEKNKACGWRDAIVVQLESMKSPPAPSAISGSLLRDGGVILFVCLFVCLSARLFMCRLKRYAVVGAYRVDPCLLLCLLWFIVAVDYDRSSSRVDDDGSFWRG